VIRFDDVVLRYPGASEAAVHGISLDAPRGALTAIVGPNGSGKSTLVRALLGRLVPERGRIMVDGDALGHVAMRRVASRSCRSAKNRRFR
jgi:ABC-type bacteriocin/lantibiotic exporter with double-glycine peptidase domain